MMSAPSPDRSVGRVDPVEVTVDRASHLVDLGRPEEAIRLLEAEPAAADHHGAAVELARANDKLGRFREALANSERAIRLDADRPSGWLLHAVALLHLDRPVEALPSARRSLELNRFSPLGHQIMARVLADLGRFDQAFEHVDRAMALDPHGIGGWVTRCRIQLAQHRWADAEASARQALAVDPESDEARLLLGVAQACPGTMVGEAEAMQTLIGSLRNNPDQHHVRALLVELVKPRRMPIPWWILVPLALAGGAGIVLLLWAGWVMFRWWRTPADVRRIVWAERSARVRIVASLLAATMLIGGLVVATGIVVVRGDGPGTGSAPGAGSGSVSGSGGEPVGATVTTVDLFEVFDLERPPELEAGDPVDP